MPCLEDVLGGLMVKDNFVDFGRGLRYCGGRLWRFDNKFLDERDLKWMK